MARTVERSIPSTCSALVKLWTAHLGKEVASFALWQTTVLALIGRKTRNRCRMIGRASGLLILTLALIAQVLTGATGRGAWPCICASKAAAGFDLTSCCATETGAGHGDTQPAAPQGCRNCVMVPETDFAIGLSSVLPSASSAVVLLRSRSLLAGISRPAVARVSLCWRHERPPPDPYLRNLRSVVLIC
jgi:hypothetical protein